MLIFKKTLDYSLASYAFLSSFLSAQLRLFAMDIACMKLKHRLDTQKVKKKKKGFKLNKLITYVYSNSFYLFRGEPKNLKISKISIIFDFLLYFPR